MNRVVTKLSTLAACLLLATAASAQGKADKGRAGQPEGADNQPKPMMMLVPVEISGPAIERGCWVQLFDERNFKGEALTIAGPIQLDALDKYSGRNLKRNIDSLLVGPQATVTVYEHRFFKDRQVVFEPNARQGGLIRELGFGGTIQSLKVDCPA